MDDGLLYLLMFTGVAAVVVLPPTVAAIHRRMRDAAWAARNGWTDATADAATSTEVLESVVDKSQPEQRTTVRNAWRGELRGFDVLLVGSRTRLGGRFDRGRAHLHNTHVFVTLAAASPLLAAFDTAGVDRPPSVPLGFRTGVPEFDARFRVIASDEEFARRVLTREVIRALLRSPDLPRSFTFEGTLLIGWLTDRVPAEKAARTAELLTTVATGAR